MRTISCLLSLYALLLAGPASAEGSCTAQQSPKGPAFPQAPVINVFIHNQIPAGIPGAPTLNERFQAALPVAASTWETARNSCGGPGPANFPEVSPATGPTGGALDVPISFRPGYFDPADDRSLEPCGNGGLLRPHAVTIGIDIFGVHYPEAILIFEQNGCSDRPLLQTFDLESPYMSPANIENLLVHEVGHILGLDHDNCADGVMNGNGSVLYDGTVKTVTPEECAKADSINKLPGPLLPGPRPWNPINPCSLGPGLAGCGGPSGPGPFYFPSCEYIPGERVTVIEGPWCIILWPVPICFPPLKGGLGATSEKGTWVCPSFREGSMNQQPESITGGDGPWVTFVEPDESEVLTGDTWIGVAVTHPQYGGEPLAFFIDKQPISLGDYQAGASFPDFCTTATGTDPLCPAVGYGGTLDTTQLSNGPHTLQVMALDHREPYRRLSWAERAIVVDNPVCLDATDPTVTLTSPATGASVVGDVLVTATANDNQGVVEVRFLVDGVRQFTDTAAPYAYTWNTTAFGPGTHTLRVKAYDACGNIGVSPLATVQVLSSPEINVLRDFDNQPVAIGGSVDLGATAPGVATSLRFRVENTGTANLVISNPMSIVSGACFSLIETPASLVAPGGMTWFRVRLLCGTAGSVAGTVSINNNDIDESLYNFSVTGTVAPATSPEVAVFRDFNNQLVGDGGSTSLGATAPGVPTSLRFRIENSGTADLVTSNPSSMVSGACFSLIESPVSPVAPGSVTWFRVRLLCTTAGNASGTVSIQNNDLDENPYNFAITGTVIPATSPEVAVYRDFNNQLVGGGGSTSIGTTGTSVPTSVRFRIENTGDADLLISNPTSIVSGACFSLIETPASLVAPGGMTWFRVRLLCGTAGNFAGAVSIDNNDLDENPFSFTVTGTVTSP